MQYILEDKQFTMHYSELKDLYTTFTEMSNEDFVARLPEALHLACAICFLKEIPTSNCLSDLGIIHELTHLLDGTTKKVDEVRELFKEQLELV